MAVFTQYCNEADFDAATQTCAAPYWAPTPSLVPRLSATEGLEVAVAIVGIWAIGFYIKSGRRVTST